MFLFSSFSCHQWFIMAEETSQALPSLVLGLTYNSWVKRSVSVRPLVRAIFGVEILISHIGYGNRPDKQAISITLMPHFPQCWSDNHYDDVIMTTIASQITSLTSVYSTVYSDADQRKHQSSVSLAFVREFTGDRWIPRTNGQLRGKCFHLMTSSWDIHLATNIHVANNKDAFR